MGAMEKKKPNSISATCYMLNEASKQEISDWPQALLAIGTFGNNNLKEDSASKNIPEDSSSFQDFIQEVTLEEVGTLQNVLNIYFPGKVVESNLVAEQEEKNITTDSSLEGKETETVENGNFYPNKSLVHSRGKDRSLNGNKSKKGVGKKSVSFLLKKMFVCRSGFQPSTPFIKDPLTTESKMEKILRAILHKKIYPQGSCSNNTSIKKYQLESRSVPCSDEEDDDGDEEEEELAITAENGCKWVNTDSEYIVLEI